jgi:uncharacterized protein
VNTFFLIASHLHPRGSKRWFSQRLKFLARAWLQPTATQTWLSCLLKPEIALLWEAHPRLATKLQRPYLLSSWNVPSRLESLLEHYAVLPTVFTEKAYLLIYGKGLTILQLHDSVSSRKLKLRLIYNDQFEKEGELSLELIDDATQLILSRITFLLTIKDNERCLIIGGLQASPSPQTRTQIHDLAKEMHGIRAKALTLWCLQQMATYWKVTQLLAVADDSHIYRHRQKRRNFAANYDEFWTECDGHRVKDGLWALPLQPRIRTREELKPSRRKQHEMRYAMFSELHPRLIEALTALTPEAAAGNIPTIPAAFIYKGKKHLKPNPGSENHDADES